MVKGMILPSQKICGKFESDIISIGVLLFTVKNDIVSTRITNAPMGTQNYFLLFLKKTFGGR
jgi:hypothetical protein